MAEGVSVLLRVGVGLTFTVTFCTFEQPLAVSVYTYTTGMVPAVVLISISFGFPKPLAAGLLIPAMAARDQAKVVPAVPLAGLYENVVLLQIAGGVRLLERIGVGFTVTTTL